MNQETAPAESATEAEQHHSAMSALFGRSLLYIVIWALQLLVTSFSSPLLAYILGPGQFGIIATAIAIFQVLLVVAVFGLDSVTLIIHAEPADGIRKAREFLAFATVFGLLACGIMFATGPLWVKVLGHTPFSGTIAIAVLWTGPSAVSMLVLAMLRAQDRLGPFCVVSLLSAIGGQVFGVIGLLTISRTATTYAWGGVVAQVLAMLVGLAIVRPLPRGLFDRVAARAGLALGLPLMLGNLSGFVLNAGDRVVIQRQLGEVQVGRYQIAYTVGSTVVLLLGFLNQVWLPKVLSIRDGQARWRLIEESRDLLMTVMIPVFLGLMLIAPMLLAVVAPSSFNATALLTVVLLVAASAFPVVDANASGRALLALKRPKAVAVSTGIAAVLNIILNIVLIPVMKIEGSALATLLAFTAQALVARLLVRRHVTVSAPAARQVAAVLLAIGLAFATTKVPAHQLWIVLRVLVGLVLAYVVYLLLTGTGSGGRHRNRTPTEGLS